MSACTYELLVVNDRVQLTFRQKEGSAGWQLLLTADEANRLAAALQVVVKAVA